MVEAKSRASGGGGEGSEKRQHRRRHATNDDVVEIRAFKAQLCDDVRRQLRQRIATHARQSKREQQGAERVSLLNPLRALKAEPPEEQRGGRAIGAKSVCVQRSSREGARSGEHSRTTHRIECIRKVRLECGLFLCVRFCLSPRGRRREEASSVLKHLGPPRRGDTKLRCSPCFGGGGAGHPRHEELRREAAPDTARGDGAKPTPLFFKGSKASTEEELPSARRTPTSSQQRTQPPNGGKESISTAAGGVLKELGRQLVKAARAPRSETPKCAADLSTGKGVVFGRCGRHWRQRLSRSGRVKGTKLISGLRRRWRERRAAQSGKRLAVEALVCKALCSAAGWRVRPCKAKLAKAPPKEGDRQVHIVVVGLGLRWRCCFGALLRDRLCCCCRDRACCRSCGPCFCEVRGAKGR